MALILLPAFAMLGLAAGSVIAEESCSADGCSGGTTQGGVLLQRKSIVGQTGRLDLSAELNKTDAVLRVMSYNTQYSGYPARVGQFGAKIRDVGAAVVGTQECQDKNALAAASGYGVVPGTDFQNPIFYNPGQVSFVADSGGWLKLPSDNHASRTLTWAKFRLGSSDFWFFNTHLPHATGVAASSMTHSYIAQTLLQKRAELGAGSAPTVVIGDMNPFASAGAPASFESALAAAGIRKAYQAQGNPGYSGLDKIFASSHWSSSNGADQGTGSSDHPAIAVDLAL
uniref:Endonuclease/exonuclease/phosphatase domain-containing protein n=1 Tax=Alexandrium catenella TaxID=2925 RepID=A0A7S1L4I1_ALECA